MPLKIEKLIYGGDGLGFKNKKPVFVPFSAQGDELEIEITEEKKSFSRGKIKNIRKPSPHRVAPKCPYYGVCGGCNYQHIDYASQLLWKQMILEEQLVRLGGLKEVDVLPTVPSGKVWGYRNRIQLHKKGDKIGYFEAGSHNVVDVLNCPIADDVLNEKISEVRSSWPDGVERLELSSSEADFFAQVNPYTNAELKKILVEWVLETRAKNILELFAGSGNFTFAINKIAEKITAVELDDNAVMAAHHYIIENKIKNVEFVMGDVVEYIGDKGCQALFGEKVPGTFADLVLLDPPREGLGIALSEKITASRPKFIIYISCDPSTLARDIKIFISGGYKLLRSQPIDMFPQTYHIESISLLMMT